MSRSVNSDKSWNSTDEDDGDTSNGHWGPLAAGGAGSAASGRAAKGRSDPLQFVKIQNNELSKKAVEQIKLAEEVKITKEKIKEVEEEWQNNLLNWKSKRRISKNNSDSESGTSSSTQRKTKTFSEILSEKAKSGQRIGYNLHKYLEGDIDNENELLFAFDRNYDVNNYNDRNSDESIKSENDDNIAEHERNISQKSGLGDVIVFDTLLLDEFNRKQNHNQRQESSEDEDSISGEVINSSTINALSNNISGDITVNKDKHLTNFNNDDSENNNKNKIKVNNGIKNYNLINNKSQEPKYLADDNEEKKITSATPPTTALTKPEKLKVEIKDWKMQNQRENILQYLMQHEQHLNQQRTQPQNMSISDEELSGNSHYNSFEAEEDDYEEEEMERLRLEQEKSFKAKLSAFEMMAKQEENSTAICNNVRLNENSRPKAKDDSLKRPPPAVEELLHSEQLQQLIQRPIYSGGQYLEDMDNDNEDVINARIQQLHIERQRAQRQQHQQQKLIQQQRGGQQVIYQSLTYPVQSAPPTHSQRNFEPQQQYYLVDEPMVKPNAIPVKQPNKTPQLPPSPPNAVTAQTPLVYPTVTSPQEHLYVNQKQLFSNQPLPQYYEPNESHERYEASPLRNEYHENNVIYDSQQSTAVKPQTQQTQAPQLPAEPYPTAQHQQYLYYPKPYAANKSGAQPPPPMPGLQKPVMKNQASHPPPSRTPQAAQQQLPAKQAKPQPPTSKPKPQQKGYNQNHWLLQEAELRRHLATIPAAPTPQQSHQAVPTQRPATNNSSSHKTPPAAPPKGMLSVSGKKKCSSCGDELGRGCAAMVVESLSLYYHISCFRCSVCNIQLGNGTVGTDVRVRNHKLHCQNCYSNDEAGLKFSRV